MYKKLINDTVYEIHENFSNSLPFRLYDPEKKKNYWLTPSADNAKYYALDFKGKKHFDIFKADLIKTEPENKLYYNGFGQVYIP